MSIPKSSRIRQRLWLPLLPVWAASLTVAVFVGSYAPRAWPLLAAAAAACAGFTVLLGVLAASNLDRLRRCERPEPVDLCALLSANAGFYQAAAEEKGLRLEVSCPLEAPAILARRGPLQTVMGNLLSNAIKHAPAGGCVTLALFTKPAEVVVEVAGMRIGAGNTCTVTEADAVMRLATVKVALEQLGGTIRVERREGRGSTFRVHLQRAARSGNGRGSGSRTAVPHAREARRAAGSRQRSRAHPPAGAHRASDPAPQPPPPRSAPER